MDPLSITASLIAVLQVTSAVISVCYDYRQGVKNASREAIQLSDELNSLKDVLDALLRLVEKSESTDQARLSTLELLNKPEGPLWTCQSELEKLKLELEPQTGWRAVRKSLIWPLKEGEMRKALLILERLKSTIQLALSADQTSLSLAIHEDVKDLAQTFERNSADQKYRDVCRWLAAPDPFENHVANRKKRQPNTGDWFLTSKQHERWLHAAKSFLWLYGIPGSGKTILCSTIIEKLVYYCKDMPKTAIAYFYFDFNDIGKRNANSLIRALITQLAAQSDTISQPLLDLYQKYPQGTKYVDDESLIATLHSMVLTFHNVYIILDALDESSDLEEVLKFIGTTQEWELSRLHLLTTSRQLAEIEQSLDNLVTDKICLQDSVKNKDIVAFISDKLANDKTLAKWAPEIRSQIQEVLLAEEGGMFRWVVCQLDMLKRCMSVAAIKKGLTALPKDLDETYDRILLEIDELHQVEVMKTLQALTVTLQSLTLEEIVEVLAVDLNAVPPKFDPDCRLLDPRSILSMCSSLVTSSSERQSKERFIYDIPGRSGQTAIALRLAHASVADYLTQTKRRTASEFHFSEIEAHQFLAQTCLVYLMNPEFANGHDRKKIKTRLKEFPFLLHAVRFWPMYLEREKGELESRIDSRTKELLQAFFATRTAPNGGNFAFWVGMLIPTSSNYYIQNTPPLYYAASFGLTDVVRLILDTEKDIDIDARGGRAHSSALHVAVFRARIDVVRLLLERGADPNLPNNKRESPMYWARGMEYMEKLLIEYGAGKPQAKSDKSTAV